MTKIIAPGTNCWQAFLACLLESPISFIEPCSTVHENWKEKTDELLKRFNFFVVEVKPSDISAIPAGTLVGANVDGPNGLPHVVIAEVVREGERQAFKIYHDPSGFHSAGTPIDPPTIVLIGTSS